MSLNAAIKEPNKFIKQNEQLLNIYNDSNKYAVMQHLYINGPMDETVLSGKLNLEVKVLKEILSSLTERGLINCDKDRYRLTPLALKQFSYNISFDFLVGKVLEARNGIENPLRNKFEIKELIGRGETSYTFRAEQSGTHRDRTLKIFLPGRVTYNKLDDALRKRADIKAVALPEIIDAGQVQIKFPNGQEDIYQCVALEYIDCNAKTFSEFLEEKENLNASFFNRFVESVAGALAAIEKVGLSHGDLHDGNILVMPGSIPAATYDFKIIDFIGVPSTSSPELEVRSDMENFRDHLLKAAILVCKKNPGCSARILLGERVFNILEKLRKGDYSTFVQIVEDFFQKKTPLSKNYFKAPEPLPFEWLRVEWIPSSELLYKLFEPVLSRFETINSFGNTWISGPRGCGKSHYLRVLAFHPNAILKAYIDHDLDSKLKQLNYNYQRAFGVLFTCRLGEFKFFTPEALGKETFDQKTKEYLKHILVLKIWNKTLSAIKEGIEAVNNESGRSLLQLPNDLSQFISFLQERLGSIAILESSSVFDIFSQCLFVCTTQENSSTSIWHKSDQWANRRLLNEKDLDEFFVIIKKVFSDLALTQFYILIDDASSYNMPFEMQKVLNMLIRAVQANHCFKLTCDKFMYTLDAADGRAIDPRHEVTYVDLGEVSTKAQRETAVDMSEYMAKVVNLRLKFAKYKFGIQEILGESQNAREFLAALSLPRAARLKKQGIKGIKTPRRKAYYAGWNIVWSISHGSVRTLLSLIEYIFNTNNITPDTRGASLSEQDKAVRSFANNQFKALTMLPGEFNSEPIGQRLQAIISTIGAMSRRYLTSYETGDVGRWYETISIERLDRSKISLEAQNLLEELIKNGLLLDEGVTFSRAQFGLGKRYDLNKIFSPAFEVTYRVRNHIYLSHVKLVELLTKPDVFNRRNQDKLVLLTQKRKEKKSTLFKDFFNND